MKYPHTRVPSWFFALLPELSECELKVMLVAMKHTLGWNRDSDFLSYSLLRDETGMGQASIAKALALLDERGLIKRNKKRIPAQHIQVFPLSPILPMVVQNMNSDSQNMNSDSQNMNSKSSYSEQQVVHIMNTQKKPPKKGFKETTTIEKFNEEQEKGLALMVGGGVDQETAKRLISKAWSRGRDISYIQRILGYVAEQPDVKNPAGMIVTLVERNLDRNAHSNGQEGGEKKKNGPIDVYAPKYQHGGIYHHLVINDCPICRAEREEPNELS